jgi:hypothetical protein
LILLGVDWDHEMEYRGRRHDGVYRFITMEELERFAQWLKARGGIEAAVGAALSVQMLMQRIRQLR